MIMLMNKRGVSVEHVAVALLLIVLLIIVISAIMNKIAVL